MFKLPINVFLHDGIRHIINISKYLDNEVFLEYNNRLFNLAKMTDAITIKNELFKDYKREEWWIVDEKTFKPVNLVFQTKEDAVAFKLKYKHEIKERL